MDVDGSAERIISPLPESGIFKRKPIHLAARFNFFEQANMLMWPWGRIQYSGVPQASHSSPVVSGGTKRSCSAPISKM